MLRYKFVLALGVLTSSPAFAQMVQPIAGVTAPDPASLLSMHLRTLAGNPRNVAALIGAGQAAIDVSDPNAALGFFARADELSPGNARAKAGLASALLLLEKPDDALRMFGEAVSLGVAESDIAKDRALAYDLRGDNRRAQRDYVVAMRRGADDEVTRRYALSLGISGDRAQALTILDPLLRKQDQAAWRARAFILAMNNDVSGANTVARQVMPASLAATMAPFLARLATLNPAERAHAVNFGTMPSDGQTFASVQIGDPFKPVGAVLPVGGAGDGLIPSGAPLGRQRVAAAPATRTATPGFTNVPAPRLGTRLGTRLATVDPAKLPPEARGEITSVTRVPAMTALPPPDVARVLAPVTMAASQALPSVPMTPEPVAMPVTSAADMSASQTTTVPLPPAPVMEADAGLARIAPAPSLAGPPAERVVGPPAIFEVGPPTPAPAAAPVSRLASILAGLEPEPESAPVALPTAAEIRAEQRVAARKATAATELAAAAQRIKDEKAQAAAAAKANPARTWVQVATGGNVRGLALTWRKIREANEKLLKPYSGFSMPYRATNRILAGPLRSAAEARTLVTALGKAGVAASSFTSEAGQEVMKLSAK